MKTTHITIRSFTGLVILNYNDILYLVGDGRYTWIYLKNGNSIISARILKVFEDILPDNPFIRIHKSYMVNLDYLKAYDKRNGGNIILENNQTLPVSKRRKKQFLEKVEEIFTML